MSLKVPVNIRATKYTTKTYSYDSTNRLTSVMRGVLEEDRFSYDGVGNRLTDIQQRNYTYNNGNELLTQNGTSFQYDANGNMVSKTNQCGMTTYQYDSENRLIGINGYKPDCSSLTASFKYDPFGRRIEKNINGTITRYIYDREDILFELDGSGNVVTEYLHSPGIDEPIAMIRNNQTYYYRADGLGSIIAITDSTGKVVQRYEYDSFGNITYQQDANLVQPYTYTGREYDQESGLYYYRARYYDAKVGRFLQQDPIGFDGGINFYTYAANNPVNLKDPYGLTVVIPIPNPYIIIPALIITTAYYIYKNFPPPPPPDQSIDDLKRQLEETKCYKAYAECLNSCIECPGQGGPKVMECIRNKCVPELNRCLSKIK